MAYVILCVEPNIGPYVLADGGADFTTTQQLMNARAEEYLDDAAVSAVEVGDEPGGLTIKRDESGSMLRIVNENDAEVLRMEMVAVEIHG